MSETAPDNREHAHILAERRAQVINSLCRNPPKFTTFPGRTEEDKSRARNNSLADMMLMYGDSTSAALAVAKLRDNKLPLSYNEVAERQYMDEAGRYPLLTSEQEVGLFTCLDNGLAVMKALRKRVPTDHDKKILTDAVAAHDVITHCNLKLALSLAMKSKWNKEHFADIVQAANEGLKDAVSRFDVTKGIKFSTYSTPWIQKRINEYFTDNQFVIRIARREFWQIAAMEKAIEKYFTHNQRYPTDEELAAEMNTSEEYVRELKGFRRLQKSLTPLDAQVDSDEESTQDPEKSLYNLLGAEALFGADSDTILRVGQAIAQANLTPAEKAVISLRTGYYFPELESSTITLSGCRRGYSRLFSYIADKKHGFLTLKEIGREFNLSTTSIRQIEMRAYSKIRGDESAQVQ